MIKYNINKLHGDLISKFPAGEIKISEKSNKDLGNHFNIIVLNEGKEVNMIVSNKEIENDNFNWSYLQDPLNEKSEYVERYSNIDRISDDVKDIFDKNRFSQEYINKI